MTRCDNMKSTDTREQSAIAFVLGRCVHEFQFYLSQAIALAILPKAPYLSGYYEAFYFDRTREVLECIEQECANIKSLDIPGFVISAQSRLDALIDDTANLDIEDKVAVLRSWGIAENRISPSRVYSEEVHRLITRRDLWASYRLHGLIRSTSLSERYNPIEQAFALGVSLDRCIHPANVVNYMTRMSDSAIIAKNSEWIREANRIVSDDKTFRVLRCFTGGDIKPSRESLLELWRGIKNQSFKVSIEKDVDELIKLTDDHSHYEHVVETRHTRDRLIEQIDAISRVIEISLANPVFSSNEKRDALAYRLRIIDRMTRKEVIRELSNAGFGQLSWKTIERGIKRHAARTGKQMLRSPQGRKSRA